MKTLLELLSEQQEQISIWIDDNPNVSQIEYIAANDVTIALSEAIEQLIN